MKEHEFLDGVSNIDTDVVERFIQLDNKLQRKANDAKSKGIWLRFGVIAACLAVIVSALIVVPLLQEEGPGVIILPPDDTAYDSEENSQMETDPGTETGDSESEWESHGGAMPDWAFYAYIDDTGFEGYRLSEYNAHCEPSLVGARVGDISIAVSFGPEKTAIVTADVYEVEGFDRTLCLCIRYRDDGYKEFYHNFLDFDAYYFIYTNSFRFSSLSEMLGLAFDSSSIRLANYWNYSRESEIQYFLNENALDEFKQLLITMDGVGMDTQNGLLSEQVHADATEFVSTSCGLVGYIGTFGGQLYVYNTGYLYHTSFGGQLFEIGQDNARALLDFVVNQGVTENYEWIEREGTWYPVIYDEDAEYANFSEALNESKLYGQLNFADRIIHWEQVCGTQYHEDTLSRKALDSIAEVLNGASDMLSAEEGRAVENNEIPGFSADEQLFNPVEAVVLTHNWDVNGESTCAITVYDSGHVELNGVYYYIGTHITDRVFEVIRFECRE